MNFACRERQRILLEAAIWQSLLEQSPSEENQSKFSAWLTKSRQHVEIYLYVSVRSPNLTVPDRDEPSHHYRSLARVSSIAAAAAVIAIALYVWSYFSAVPATTPIAGTVYQDAGTFTLGTDSFMTLRQGSRVTVFHSTESTPTRVEIDAGYAEFTGKHGPTSPLIIVSDNVVADVLGTTLNVFRKPGTTIVTVTEGRVRVTLNCASRNYSGSAPTEAVLTEDRYVEVASDNCSGPLLARAVESAFVRQQVTLSSDWLDFDQKTVQEATDQLNQYNVDRERLVIRSAILGTQLIGGRFHPSDVDSFLLVLKRNYNVRITRHTEPDGTKVIYLDLAAGK